MAAKSRTKSSFEAFYKNIQNILDNELSEEVRRIIYPVTIQWFEEQNRLLSSMLNDNKRLLAINFDTIFDAGLKKILMLHFLHRDKDVLKLFEPSIGGPLVSLTHKARLIYALGLIDKMALSDFENFHKIRNEFAHNEDVNFEETKIVKLVGKLSTAKDHKVKPKESFKFFESVLNQCVQYIKQAVDREFIRQATLKSGKKHKEKKS